MSLKSYWITDYSQIEALAHPARHEIVDRLAALGPTGARELAKAIGRRVTTIYHHLQFLENVGLIEISAVEGSQGGRPYSVYRTKAPRMRLTRAAIDPNLRKPLSKWVKIVGNEAARQYVGALDRGDFTIKGARRNMWFYRVVCSPSRQRLARINELFEELAELVWTPDPKPGPLVSIGWFVSPLGQSPTKRPPSESHSRT